MTHMMKNSEDWHGHKLDREMLELLQAYQQHAGKR
jgi:hypothetical protein